MRKEVEGAVRTHRKCVYFWKWPGKLPGESIL